MECPGRVQLIHYHSRALDHHLKREHYYDYINIVPCRAKKCARNSSSFCTVPMSRAKCSSKGKVPSIQVKEKLLLSSCLPTVQSRWWWYLSAFHIWITTGLRSFFFSVAFFYCLLFPIEKRNTAHLPITLVVFQLLVHSEHFLESIPVSVLEILFLELTTSSSNLDWVLLRPTHSRLSGSSFLQAPRSYQFSFCPQLPPS